jgi:large subunit ribosomal protein L4e
MKANVLGVDGKKKKELTLPPVFKEDFRPDIIKRAVLSIQSHNRQQKGTDPEAGKRKSVFRSKKRRAYRGTYGMGTSRTPTKVIWRRGRRFFYVGAFAPQTRGGRTAHPPLVGKNIEEKINKKERITAIRSAIAATADKDLVGKRHRLGKTHVPIVVESKAESLKRTSDVQKMLESLGLADELERTSQRKKRPGKGKMRGRPYRKRKGPLFIVGARCDLMKSAKNIPGADVSLAKDLNAELLAPGCQPGRLCVWSEGAIKEVEVLFK